MAFFPFILIRDKKLVQDITLLNHERVHLRQQVELMILPFYIWYIVEYLIRLIIYKNKQRAYRNISFEREAYANENNIEYLNKRKLWAFLKYI